MQESATVESRTLGLVPGEVLCGEPRLLYPRLLDWDTSLLAHVVAGAA